MRYGSTARSRGLAEAQKEVDVATFVQWVDAYAHGETELTTFYARRFRAEFEPAFWLARHEAADERKRAADAVRHASVRLAAEQEAARLDAEAKVSAAVVRRNIQRASNYILGVVLFSVALFFAGMSTKLATPRLRSLTLAVGCVVFLERSSIWPQPVSVAV